VPVAHTRPSPPGTPGVAEVGGERFVASLTMLAHKPNILIEQATPSYSFRFSELSQPI